MDEDGRVRVVLDACVLVPPVLREVLLGVAAQGLFQPLWSDRLLEEWARAAMKAGPEAALAARTEAARLQAAFPASRIPPAPHIEARLHLPDPNDLHVLAIAIAGSADTILTFNARDFPRHTLAEEGLGRADPDGFLWLLWSHHPQQVAAAVTEVHRRAEAIAGAPRSIKALLKKVQLPRFAKALASDMNAAAEGQPR